MNLLVDYVYTTAIQGKPVHGNLFAVSSMQPLPSRPLGHFQLSIWDHFLFD